MDRAVSFAAIYQSKLSVQRLQTCVSHEPRSARKHWIVIKSAVVAISNLNDEAGLGQDLGFV